MLTRESNPLFRVGAIFSSLALLLASVFILSPAASADISFGGPFNCDANAVMYCGAATGANLVSKYNSGDGRNTAQSIQDIYSHFNISSADIQSIPTTAVTGSVASNGDVLVNNQVVATQALTEGRSFIPGSTQVTSNGTTFYTRPPSVSFLSSPLAAFVVMNGSQFKFAILASCGNAVVATSVAPPPAPVSTPPTPTPTPTPTPPATTTSTPPTTTPAPTSTPPKALPNTGTSLYLSFGLFVLATAAGYMAFKFLIRRNLAESL